MGTRPLNNEEVKDTEVRLRDAKGRRQLLDTYIADLEQRLQKGTCWSSDLSFEEMKSIEVDCKAFIAWRDSGCKGEMPKLHEYKWSWQQ